MNSLFLFWEIYFYLLVPPAPVGPLDWTAKNWIGLALQLGLFFLALFFISKLADLEEEESPPDPPSNSNSSSS
ncbi:MAG: hypothetical protein AABZ60_04445 [Planctomycetota bacterium]